MTDRQQQWIERAQALGKAQARSLWLLLVAAIFFLAVGSGTPADSAGKSVPLLGRDVTAPAWVVRASGPFVLSFLVTVAMGALRARGVAIENAGGDTKTAKANEPWDVNPNPLDLAKYSQEETPLLLRRFSLLGYPVFLTLIMIEVGWLAAELAHSYSNLPVAGKWLLWASVPVVVVAAWQVVTYFFKATCRAFFDPDFWNENDTDSARREA